MWKFLSLATALLFVANFAFSQSFATDKGSIIVGGTAGFSSQGGDMYESGGDRANSLSVNPEFGFFVAPSVAIGGTAVINYVSQGDASSTTIGGGPSISYLIGGPESKTYPFVSLSPVYTSVSYDYGSFDSSASGFGMLGQVGAVMMAARNVGVNVGIFYLYESYSSDDFDDSMSGNTYGVQVGITAFVY